MKPAAHEHFHGIVGPINDGFAVQVERRIEKNSLARSRFVFLEQPVIIGVVLLGYFVRPRREIVRVLCGGKGRPLLHHPVH